MPPLLSPRWYLWIGGALLVLSIAGLAITAAAGASPYPNPVPGFVPFIGYAVSAGIALRSRTRSILFVSVLGIFGFYFWYHIFAFSDEDIRTSWISFSESVTLFVQRVSLAYVWGMALVQWANPDDARTMRTTRTAAGVLLGAIAIGGVFRVIQTVMQSIMMGSAIQYLWNAPKGKEAATVFFGLSQLASLLEMVLPFFAALLSFRRGQPGEDLRRRARRVHLLSLVSGFMLAAGGVSYFFFQLLADFKPSWSDVCDLPSFALVCALLALAVGRSHLEDYQRPRQFVDPPPVIP